MNGKYIIIAALALAVGVVSGFLGANAINRSDTDRLRAELDALKSEKAATQNTEKQLTLSEEEIKAKIAEADANPDSFDFQKNLGVALYRYATMKQDTSLIKDSIRILERAVGLRANDRDVVFSLGNAYFDIGYFGKEMPAFETARDYYGRMLKQDPKDVDAHTERALTYFVQDPPEYAKATEGFEAALSIDPNHERSLQFLIQSEYKQGNVQNAVKHFDRLRAVNAKNPAIPELTQLLSQPATK